VNNIILIGFMGSGKTSVGKALASKCGRVFVDMDEEIVKQQGKSINEIFLELGEAGFRDIETRYIQSLHECKNTILSTGGGVVTREENIELLKALGTIVFLNTPYEQLIHNLKGDTQRPLLRQENAGEVIFEMLQKREPLYFKAATMIVQTKGKTIQEIADEIIKLL